LRIVFKTLSATGSEENNPPVWWIGRDLVDPRESAVLAVVIDTRTPKNCSFRTEKSYALAMRNKLVTFDC
jgi:hypothetical protein